VANATQTQIQSAVALPTFVVEVKRSGSWVDVSADVVKSGSSLTTASGDNGLAFGAFTGATATVELAREQIGEDWEMLPIRISYGFDTSDKAQQFVGAILAADSDADTVTYDCAGYHEVIARAEVYSPLFRRRAAATATSLTSIDDPNEPAYAAGPINYILWQCGGRPIEQIAAYPTADFYYSCQQAIIAPDWQWCAGENNWTELDRLCKAVGGQIAQAADGVMYYTDPLLLSSGTAAHVFTDADVSAAARVSGNLGSYGSIRVSASVRNAVSKVTCRFTRRRVLGVREVYRDKPNRYLDGDEVTTLYLNTQLPIYDLDRVELRAAKLRGGSLITEVEIDPLTISVLSQQITIGITNPEATPIVLYEIALFGRPLAATEEGDAFYTGSTSRPYATVREIPDSPLIQSYSHAKRLCRMLYDFTAAAATSITLEGCGFDPDRTVGETVGLTSSAHGYSALTCRIVGIEETAGETMSVTLAPTAGLPTRSTVWIVGTSYSGANTRELSY